MKTPMQRFIRDARGATAVEYGLLAGLIAVAIIGSVTAIGSNTSATLTYLAQKVNPSAS